MIAFVSSCSKAMSLMTTADREHPKRAAEVLPSRHNLVLLKVAQIISLVHFSPSNITKCSFAV